MKNCVKSLFLAAVVLLATVGCQELKKKDSPKQPVKVTVETVGTSSESVVKTYIGKVEASRSAVITSPFPAKLEKLNIKQGQTVRGGTQVAKIYSETVASTLSAAAATMRQAQDGYDRLQAIKDNGSVPQIKIVEVETSLEKAKAALNSAQKAANDCSVKAPFSGTVSEVYCEEGEDIALARPIVKIIDLNSLEINISVPETEISSYNVGNLALVSVPAIGEKPFQAVLSHKGFDASLSSHSYDCRLRLKDMPDGLMPGMIGKVTFQTEAPSADMPVVSASIVRTDRNGRYVWTVDGENVVGKRYVTTGDFVGKGVRILSGLDAGDRVIVEGTAKVSTGMKVAVQ